MSVVAAIYETRRCYPQRDRLVICGTCGVVPLHRAHCSKCGSDKWQPRQPISFEEALRQRREREAQKEDNDGKATENA